MVWMLISCLKFPGTFASDNKNCKSADNMFVWGSEVTICAQEHKSPKYLRSLPAGTAVRSPAGAGASFPSTPPRPSHKRGAPNSQRRFHDRKHRAGVHQPGALTAEFSRQPSSTRMRQPLRIFFGTKTMVAVPSPMAKTTQKRHKGSINRSSLLLRGVPLSIF